MRVGSNKLPAKLRSAEAKRIATTTGVGLLLALVYARGGAKLVSVDAHVVPAGQSKGGALGAQLAGALGGSIELPVIWAGTPTSSAFAAVLESRSVTDAVIGKFDLTKALSRELHRAKRARSCGRTARPASIGKAKLVSLSCEDKDPTFVQGMLEYFGEYGNEVFRRLALPLRARR